MRPLLGCSNLSFVMLMVVWSDDQKLSCIEKLSRWTWRRRIESRLPVGWQTKLFSILGKTPTCVFSTNWSKIAMATELVFALYCVGLTGAMGHFCMGSACSIVDPRWSHASWRGYWQDVPGCHRNVEHDQERRGLERLVRWTCGRATAPDVLCLYTNRSLRPNEASVHEPSWWYEWHIISNLFLDYFSQIV